MRYNGIKIMEDETKTALMEMVKKCFEMNRTFDRMVSVLGVDFAYNKTSKLVHQYIAHYFPTLADLIGERCLERYNISVEYGETPEAKEHYDNVQDIIANMCDVGLEFQSLFISLNQIALKNNDLHIYANLQELLIDYNKIVEQLILLNDKINVYKDNPSFDSHIDGFWILE